MHSAATLQQESACRLVAEATERLTGSAGELRSLVGGLRVAPAAPAQPSDSADPGDSAMPRLPALFGAGDEQPEDELAPKRRRLRKVALT